MSKITLFRGDITKIKADAMVNAANSSLLGGGGVDGAIHRAGGPEILEECISIREKQGGCPTGEAVLTTAGKLPAKFVIHTVGPIWDPAKEGVMNRLLSNCYRNSLTLALDNGLKTLAFPNISTGVYGFPKEKAAKVAIESVRAFLSEHNQMEEVRFVCFDEENFNNYERILAFKPGL